MSKNNYIVGIDVGSSSIKTVIGRVMDEEDQMRIVGVGIVPSFGIRRGSIIDIDEIAKGISESVTQAEKMSGVQVGDAIVSIGGAEMTVQTSKGVVAVGRADGEVSEDDIMRAISEAQAIPVPMNREIVHVIPKKYRLDDQDDIKNPLSMKGVRLEVEALVVESSASHMTSLEKCMSQAGVGIMDVALEPLAAAKSILSKKQKELGVVLINVGGGTTSICVYEEGEVLHTAILPVGANHITNDIAIGLRTSIEVAEKVKLEYGSALISEVDSREEIDLSLIDSQEDGVVSRYHVAEIIEARLVEIFEMVQKELVRIDKAGLLPAGAVLVGGGAKLPHVVDLAKEVMGLPMQIGFPTGFNGLLDKIDDPSFATPAGLLMWGEEHMHNGSEKGGFGISFPKGAEKTLGKIGTWIKKFLP